LFFAAEAAHSHTPFLIGRLRSIRWYSELQSVGPDLLRCIFGSMPARTVAVAPSWLAWNDGVVVKLARSAYEERVLPSGTLDSSRLAVLADALEESG
jgi:hypothetical protein